MVLAIKIEVVSVFDIRSLLQTMYYVIRSRRYNRSVVIKQAIINKTFRHASGEF